MTAFSNDVYMAGHPRPRNLAQARGHAGRRGRVGGSVGRCSKSGGSIRVCRGGLITSLELPYKLSRDEPAGVRNRARPSMPLSRFRLWLIGQAV